VAIALSMIAVAALRGQPEPPRRHETRWVVVSDPATDLWYHTLAVLGVHGPGTLPLYDSDYAQAIAGEKARRAVGPSALDREATRLKRAIMADSAFEVLHFLPLYLDRTPPEALPRALRHIAVESRATVAPERVLGALRSSLSSRAERQVLSDLADAIEDEWQTFYADYAASRAALVAERRRVLQSRWDTAFAPRLDPVFRAVGARGGVLLISPPLGIDGRVVNLGVAGMIVAVSDAAAVSAADAPLLAAIRELCFPLLQHIRDVDPVARAHAARGADESGGAAVQCGAWLVDALMPSFAIEYRALFLPARAGESPATYRRRFDKRFAIDAATLGALSQLITGNSSHPSLPLGR
jgi:hypothetical protein